MAYLFTLIIIVNMRYLLHRIFHINQTSKSMMIFLTRCLEGVTNHRKVCFGISSTYSLIRSQEKVKNHTEVEYIRFTLTIAMFYSRNSLTVDKLHSIHHIIWCGEKKVKFDLHIDIDLFFSGKNILLTKRVEPLSSVLVISPGGLSGKKIITTLNQFYCPSFNTVRLTSVRIWLSPFRITVQIKTLVTFMSPVGHRNREFIVYIISTISQMHVLKVPTTSWHIQTKYLNLILGDRYTGQIEYFIHFVHWELSLTIEKTAISKQA